MKFDIDDLIKKIIKENYVVILDFDYTLTDKNSNSSIGVFTNYLPQKYVVKKKKLDIQTNKYNNKYLLSLIWYKKLKLLSKYYSLDALNAIDYDKEFMINKHTLYLLEELLNNNANVIVCSSGMKEIIKKVLILNNIDVSKLSIIANDIDFKSKKVVNKIINPKNKKKRIKDLKKNNKVVLVGDSYNDLNICKKAIKVLVENDNMRLIEGDL